MAGRYRFISQQLAVAVVASTSQLLISSSSGSSGWATWLPLGGVE